MARFALYRSIYAVYVYDERGVAHHRPHAHIKKRSLRVASIYLETGQLFDEVEPLPKGLYEEILAGLEEILELWEELNQ